VRFRREKKPKEKREEVKQVAETAVVAAADAASSEVPRVTLEPSWPQPRAILRVITIILLVAALLWVLYKLQGVILLIVLSIFFSYLVAPLIEFVHRPFKMRGREHVVPRTLAIGIVYLVIFSVLGLGLYILLPRLGDQIKDFAKQSTTMLQGAQARAGRLNDWCRNNQIDQGACNAINDGLTKAINSAKDYAEHDLPGVVGSIIISVLGYIPWLILIPILSFFFLKDADSFRRSALQMLPRGRWRWRGDEFFQDVNSTLAAYIRAQLTICVFIATVCTTGFIILRVPSPLVLGVMAGLLEFIPLVGPLFLAIIATAITGFSSGSGYNVLWVILFLGTLRIVNDYTIYPRIIGQGIHLHPLAVILAIICGAEVAGVAGVFLAIPVIAIATVSYRHWLEHRGSEGLVADILQPPEEEVVIEPDKLESEAPVDLSHQESDDYTHPTYETTPEEMARARPDLTTGELKLPKMD
jgi:predicted PurR-regulated permease PerM